MAPRRTTAEWKTGKMRRRRRTERARGKSRDLGLGPEIGRSGSVRGLAPETDVTGPGPETARSAPAPGRGPERGRGRRTRSDGAAAGRGRRRPRCREITTRKKRASRWTPSSRSRSPSRPLSSRTPRVSSSSSRTNWTAKTWKSPTRLSGSASTPPLSALSVFAVRPSPDQSVKNQPQPIQRHAYVLHQPLFKTYFVLFTVPYYRELSNRLPLSLFAVLSGDKRVECCVAAERGH